ncbi:hypothetical protein [Pseudonocardia endophytica]|uniref:arsenate reductase/protein-tyrosine-phosphatase family protein n=1 Tax=Pseudonocardia endophytica TaxID=401976 RepID=UPI001A9DE09A
MGGTSADVFRVLFVCTGNICRSPSAEILTRHLLRGRLGGREAARFDVRSAGVQAVVGSGIHPMARAQLAPWGLDDAHSAGFVARQLRGDVLAGVDLVLGATPRHRSAILEEFPHLLDRTFSLREFARLAAELPRETLPPDAVARGHSVVAGARGMRGRVPAPDDDDIPDPMGGPPEAHRLSTTLIFDALRTVLDVLAPRNPPAPPSGPPRRPLPPPQVRHPAQQFRGA